MSETVAMPTIVDPVRVGPVAHGGHCVARHDGRVIFVRHALPGELVRLVVTDISHDRYWRADAVSILESSPDRTTPSCPVAVPAGCGGCDLQHVTTAGQLQWKTAVVREVLERLGGFSWDGEVQSVEPSEHWRTRMAYVTDAHGRLGQRRHRSHEVIPLPEGGCRIAAEQAVVTINGVTQGEPEVSEYALGRAWHLAADGFWQVHPQAAEILGRMVVEGLDPRPGDRAFDLYCGVGLFAGALADRGVQVWGVEFDRTAIDYARRNLADHRSARFSAADVHRQLRRMPSRTDLVILDPPRKGAGGRVIAQIVDRHPRAIAYVACDPAALARDLRQLTKAGYRVSTLRAFDLFPQTHHVECVAIFVPHDQGGPDHSDLGRQERRHSGARSPREREESASQLG